MKNVILLGSTGSIGKSTLQIVDHLPEEFKIVALAVKENIEDLAPQIVKYRPEIVAVYNENKAKALKNNFPNLKIVSGREGLIEVATLSSGDVVVAAIAGTLGLESTLHAIKAGKTIALANKEVLVSGGEIVMKLAKKNQILPVDSEHSALFQCLNGEKELTVRRLILTSSGGPFRNKSDLSQVTVDEALNHPTWKMGPKVTIDSSTLMNKGLEVIEAYYLFNTPIDKIEVIIHPQSVIHSMIEFIDGSIKAQMSKPDMKMPIQYALTYPNRMQGLLEPFDFTLHSKLEFFKPDTVKFKCLRLAFDCLKEGGSFPGTLNAANEILVERFLNKEISWQDIGDKLENLLNRHKKINALDFESVWEIDLHARRDAKLI